MQQRAEEGSAEELYVEIQNEKVKLIKEGKIKKEKPLPDITDAEKPFNIPENRLEVSTCPIAHAAYTPAAFSNL